MSSSTPQPATGAEQKDTKERSSFGKVLSRVKTVLKKSGASSRRKSTLPPAAPTAPLVSAPAPAAPKKPQYEGATVVPRKQVHEERAKKLAKYGFEIKPSEWHATEGDVLRVEKPIRVRIHRECHNCQATFSTGNKCPSCNHTRCKHCVRVPPKRTDAEKLANRERRDALIKGRQEWAPIVPYYGDSDELEKPVLTRPSRTGGQDLVFKKTRQRTRRLCHKCNTTITSPSRTCEKCNHKRCGDCPRSPTSKGKYPYGYPHDEPGENQPAFYSCQDCHKMFPKDAPEGTECSTPTCSHKKCADCERVKPRKVDATHNANPEVLAAINAHLSRLNILP